MDRRVPNAERKHRLNREIMAPQVRLNGVDNEPLGIVPTMARCSTTGRWRAPSSPTYSASRRSLRLKSTCIVPTCHCRPIASLSVYSIFGP